MFVDNGGALWLSDPSVVLVVLAGVVGLIYWCHRWLETGSMPTPRNMAIRQIGSSVQPRTLRQKVEARRAAAAEGHRELRTRRTGSYPQRAA